MSWRLSVCTRMTRQFRSWPPEKPISRVAGSIFVMTDPLAERDRRRRYSIIHAIEKGSTPRHIWPGMPVSSRRTLMKDTESFMSQGERLGPSWKRRVGCMPGARSSPWPISRKTPDARRPARRRSRCHRSLWRSCVASMRCSRSSDRSTGNPRTNVWRFAGTKADLWSRNLSFTCARNWIDCPADMTSPRRSITFSNDPLPSGCSSRMAVYACRTMPPSAGCAVWLLAEKPGCSAGLTRARLTAHLAMSL
jgi:hypothetical protein